MISKIILYVDNLKYIDKYREVGVSTFLFALEGYCVGYNTNTIDEINNVNVSNKFVLINRVLESKDIDNLRKILPKLEVDGIFFEDVGVYNLIKELNLDIKTILFQNHFNTNSFSVNFWLDRVDSVVISNELTYDELKEIVNKSKKSVVLNLYGYNQVMYSRRLLLSNWSDEFNIPYKDKNVIEDVATHVRFRAIENEYGTVMYSDKIFNGKELLDLDNVLFFYVNSMMIDHEGMIKYLKDLKRKRNDTEDDGFLDKPTIYKLKEKNK